MSMIAVTRLIRFGSQEWCTVCLLDVSMRERSESVVDLDRKRRSAKVNRRHFAFVPDTNLSAAVPF